MVINDDDFPPLPTKKPRWKRSLAPGQTTRKPARSSTVAAFNELPDELILEVLSYLSPMERRQHRLRTLSSLARTCRRLYCIVSPKVYEQYFSYCCKPYAFLRTIIRNPLLAEHVHHVHIVYGAWDPLIQRRVIKDKPNAQDKKTIKEGIRVLGLPDWKNWVAECITDNTDLETLYAIMLSYTPKITSLKAHEGNSHGHKNLRWVEVVKRASIDPGQGRIHAFKHLRSIEVNLRASSLFQIAPIFQLPSLRRFTALELSDEDKQDAKAMAALQRILPPASNNIEELYLRRRCSMSSGKLTLLIASSRRLKSFAYNYASDEGFTQEDDTGPGLRSNSLSAILDSQKTFLESVEVTTDDIHLTIPQALGFQSLTAYQSLRHLQCPIESICDAKSGLSVAFVGMLPPSLETLHVNLPRRLPLMRHDGKCANSVERLVGNIDTLAPALESLHVSPGIEYDWKRCESLCSKIGLTFTAEKVVNKGASWLPENLSSSDSSSEEF